MSSLETSSPVSASTFIYLMRWPVLLVIWLKLIFSESEVAGYKATGQVTRERRKKPFQLARGAIRILQTLQNPDSRRTSWIGSDNPSDDFWGARPAEHVDLAACNLFFFRSKLQPRFSNETRRYSRRDRTDAQA